jgi:COBRA-like protein.
LCKGIRWIGIEVIWEMIGKYTEDITVDCSLIQKGLGFDTQL